MFRGEADRKGFKRRQGLRGSDREWWRVMGLGLGLGGHIGEGPHGHGNGGAGRSVSRRLDPFALSRARSFGVGRGGGGLTLRGPWTSIGGVNPDRRTRLGLTWNPAVPLLTQ